MLDLTTTHMGLTLKSPIVVASNPLNYETENIVQMQAAGAGAVVLPSLFEEQVRLEEYGFGRFANGTQPAVDHDLAHSAEINNHNFGSGRFLTTIYQAKKQVDIPIIASLNGSYMGGWVRYAKLFESAGADGLELNIYDMPLRSYISSGEIEDGYVQLVSEICAAVQIPVAVKLSPYFTSLPHMAARLAKAGARTLVLFNRFYQPDIDLDSEMVAPNLKLSTPDELRLRLRWAAMLFGRIDAEIAITGGVHSGRDVLKSILAGANSVTIASAILKNGIDHIKNISDEVREWMETHEYNSIADMHGQLSHSQIINPSAFERANYIQVLRSYETAH